MTEIDEMGAIDWFLIEAHDKQMTGALAGASSGLLSAGDAASAAEVMTPNRIGLCVFENVWSIPFAVAAREAGCQLVAHGHIPTQALVAALDADAKLN